MPIDQCHEQNNEVVKGSGEAVGLTENPSAFKKWMTAGPEQAQLLKEFECEFMREASDKQLHHEEGFWMQKAFKEQAQNLVEVINEMGNPFLHESKELLVLDTRDVVDESVVTTIRCVEKLSTEQYEAYNKSVIRDQNTSIHEAIKKNSLPLFKHPTPKTKSKQTEQIAMLKHDVELFSRLYIVMQHREGDMATFFKHENHPYPPSLSDRGRLRLGKKSDLLSVLSAEAEKEAPVAFDVKVLDGAAIVHLLSTNGVSTFDDYASDVFIPYIKKQIETSKRVDVVWDTYVTCSIKESTREKRGRGMRREVAGRNKLPSNWIDFLHNSVNKQQLFSFLSHKLESMVRIEGKHIMTTIGTSVASAGGSYHMQACNHEEADTRILIHLLGLEKSTALPVFHSFTGCDTTAFFGKGKRSAWEAWKSFTEVTTAFIYIANHPYMKINIECEHFKLLEHFCVVIYDKTSILELVNVCRKELFCQKNRTMESIPPTQDPLLQHSKRVVYQAGIWTTSNISQQELPSPEGHGWQLNEQCKWSPVWINLPMASKACNELVKCGCKSSRGCGGRCACKKAQWKCTELCSCHCEK